MIHFYFLIMRDLSRITYDKYFPETDEEGEPKSHLYLNIGPRNQDQRYSQEYLVYDWNQFFSDMGSYTGLLLGWSFLSILEMVVDFLDILIRKKLSMKELNTNLANLTKMNKDGF